MVSVKSLIFIIHIKLNGNTLGRIHKSHLFSEIIGASVAKENRIITAGQKCPFFVLSHTEKIHSVFQFDLIRLLVGKCPRGVSASPDVVKLHIMNTLLSLIRIFPCKSLGYVQIQGTGTFRFMEIIRLHLLDRTVSLCGFININR